MMKILITGNTGCLGSALTLLLFSLEFFELDKDANKVYIPNERLEITIPSQVIL
jgi:nucleoside-diphosphate-sugar epimerase